jgi:hypothetical protein
MLWFRDWFDQDPATLVDEVLDNLEPNNFVASETTILDSVDLFAAKSNDVFYVIRINQVIGVLRYSDLFKPLGRLAFLALALELEDLALRLCQSATIAERCWLSLANKRRLKATDLYDQLYSAEQTRSGPAKRSVARLLQCTQLTDKATMIWKQSLLAPANRSEVLGIFRDLQKIRDWCAHPGNESNLLREFPAERLVQLAASAKHLHSSLNKLAPPVHRSELSFSDL